MNTGFDRWNAWTAKRPRHPSDFLFSNQNTEGDDLTFEEAMRYCDAQAEGELVDWRTMQPNELMSEQEIARAITDLEVLKAAAEQALIIYHQHENDEAGRNAVFEAFGGSDIAWKQLIAAAAQEDNYAGLAI